MATKIDDHIEDAIESATQAAQDFQRGLLSIALRGELNTARVIKLQYALDGMRKALRSLERVVLVEPYESEG